MHGRWVTAACVGGVIAWSAWSSAAPPASPFEYDRARASNITIAGQEVRGAATITDLSYDRLTSGRRGAYLVTPTARGTAHRPAVLFVHWYEPPNPT